MKNKKGSTSEATIMIYRVMIILFTAFIVLGISSAIYQNNVDIKTSEAQILGKKISNCITEEATIYPSILRENKENILEYCGYSKEEIQRFTIKIEISYDGKTETYKQGSLGEIWISQFIKEAAKNNQDSYNYGISTLAFPIHVCIDEICQKGEINIITIVNEENL